MSAVTDMDPKSAAYLPAVFRDSAAVGHDPVHALLQAFEKNLFRAERIAADSGLLFDPDALGLLFDPDEVGSPTFPVRRFKRKGTNRENERRIRRSELETMGDASVEEPSKTASSEPLQNVGWELEFLKWLASCVLLDWDEEWLDKSRTARQLESEVTHERQDFRYDKIRQLIKNIASLYRERGTPRGLERTIKHFYDWDVEVIERSWPQGMRVGVNSSIGADSWLVEEPDPETQFTVLVCASEANLSRLGDLQSQVKAKLSAPAEAERDVWFLGPAAAGSTSLLTKEALKNSSGLIQKLRNQSDSISAYLWNRFPKAAQEILAHGDPVSEQVQSALVSELNKIIQGRSIYETKRFPTEMLSTETRALLAQKLESDRLFRLNRLLLSDAYAAEIAIDKAEDVGAPLTETHTSAAPAEKPLAATLNKLRDLIEREKPAHTRFFLAIEAGQPEAALAQYPWLRIGLDDDLKASLFSPNDFKDIHGLVQKLVHHSDPVSLFLWNRFSQKTQNDLQQGAVPEQQSDLVEDFNKILRGESIYESERFDRVRLSRETEALNSEERKDSGLVRLNRLLLEDAYPQIARSPKTPSSIVGRFWFK